MTVEIELKLKVEDPRPLESKLQNLAMVQDHAFEDNLLMDQNQRLRSADCALRLRKCGNHNTLTFKGPKQGTGDLHTRQELESTIDDFDTALKIFEALGFKVVFRYQKYRTIWRLDQQTLIMLDQTPIGWFLEVEGPPNCIKKAVAKFSLDQYEIIRDTYPVYFQKQFATKEKLNMIF